MQLLFANQAFSALVVSIGTADTTAQLTPGSGALFPTLGVDQYFVATLTDPITRTIVEIVWVTAISGDQVTLLRGQEGTTPLNWVTNSLFLNLWTAGQAAVYEQMNQPITVTQTVVTFNANSSNNSFLSVNPNRKYLWWQNIGAGDLTIAPGTGPVTANQGQSVGPGVSGPFGMTDGLISLQAFSGISVVGTTLVVWEGQ